MKVAFLIPSTTIKRPWTKMEDTYLYNYLSKSLLNTLTDKHEYTMYINIDKDDPIYNKRGELDKLIILLKNKIKVKIISDGKIQKGYVTGMWNYLFKIAYNDNNDYFYQCGDDIDFQHIGWLDTCIDILKSENNIGVCGPLSPPMSRILTQTLVSRKHMEIFGYYFPPEIKNWWCDDWINIVYHPQYLYMQKSLLAINKGGEPRYTRLNSRENKYYKLICFRLANRDKKKITRYITHN